MLYERYSGEFLSRLGHVYRAEIWQEAAAPFSTIGELTFPSEEPLQIEWNEVDKEEPVASSICTLQIESPSDRKYIDLYTIKTGTVRLDVYRDDALYWSGTLDPETYEEPYERGSLYDVQLTFYDLGNLERLKFLPEDAEEAMPTVAWYIDYILSRAGLNYASLDTSLISTTTTDGKAILSNLRLRVDNFTDEDGEQSNLKDMLTDILQPLALRMVQRGGKIWLYDLNGLYSSATPEAATWDGDSQTLGTDVVYNNVKITFSPYANTELLDGDDFALPTSWYDASKVDMFMDASETADISSRTVFSYIKNYSEEVSNDEVGSPYWQDGIQRVDFTLHVCGRKKTCSPLTIGDGFGTNPRFLHIEPNYGSVTATDCVATLLWEGGIYREASSPYKWICPHQDHKAITIAAAGYADDGTTSALHASNKNKLLTVFTVDPIFIPPMADTKNLFLRLKLPQLLDVRYNPFEDAGEYNEQGNSDTFNDSRFTVQIYIPVRILLKDGNGNVLMHYTNENLLFKNSANRHEGIPVGTLSQYTGSKLQITDQLTGGWILGDAPTNGTTSWLSYYAVSNNTIAEKPFSGWTNNKRCARPASGEENGVHISVVAEDNMEGEYIPYPPSSYIPSGGYLEIQVLHGLKWVGANGIDIYAMGLGDFEYSDTRWQEFVEDCAPLGRVTYKDNSTSKRGAQYIRWQLFKCPTLELVKRTGAEAGEESDDVEYSGYINKDAYDELSLDTTCGTLPSPCTTARGSFFYGGTQLTELTRAGITACPEKLLIGTLISQYRDRRTTLSGDALPPEPIVTTYTERSQDSSTLFMLKEEVLDAISDVSEIKLVELRPDEVTDIEEVEED